MQRILLTGKTGQVGAELLRTLAPLGKLIAPDRQQLDLAQADSIRRVIREARPDIIVNAAGLTIVDRAQAEPEHGMRLNGVAPGIMAETAKEIGALFIHYSTTFVFDGDKREPYTESDAPRPINAYGRSKLAGEQAVTACGGDYAILRANWVYSARRSNFVLAILKLAREKRELDIVADQVGSPTWARAYAETTAELVKQVDRVREHSGTYHLSAGGHCTRLEWAQKLIETMQALSGEHSGWASLRPTTTAQYPHPAPRPLYTVTNNDKIRALLGIQMAPWDEQLGAFLRELAPAILAKIYAIR